MAGTIGEAIMVVGTTGEATTVAVTTEEVITVAATPPEVMAVADTTGEVMAVAGTDDAPPAAAAAVQALAVERRKSSRPQEGLTPVVSPHHCRYGFWRSVPTSMLTV